MRVVELKETVGAEAVLRHHGTDAGIAEVVLRETLVAAVEVPADQPAGRLRLREAGHHAAEKEYVLEGFAGVGHPVGIEGWMGQRLRRAL